jgi:hypothetical protein
MQPQFCKCRCILAAPQAVPLPFDFHHVRQNHHDRILDHCFFKKNKKKKKKTYIESASGGSALRTLADTYLHLFFSNDDVVLRQYVAVKSCRQSLCSEIPTIRTPRLTTLNSRVFNTYPAPLMLTKKSRAQGSQFRCLVQLPPSLPPFSGSLRLRQLLPPLRPHPRSRIHTCS